MNGFNADVSEAMHSDVRVFHPQRKSDSLFALHKVIYLWLLQ